MKSSITCLAFLLFASCASSVSANHVLTGNVTESGLVDTSEGKRHYHAVAHALMPVVAWEDLAADGVTVESCSAHRIAFGGNVDPTDFMRGTVVTFPEDVYQDIGCPAPPRGSRLSKVDEVVFRKIKWTRTKKGSVVIFTTYISGAMVMPEIEVEIGDLETASRQSMPAWVTDLVLLDATRTNNIGASYRKGGSKTLFSGATVSYNFGVNGGVCAFKFKRWPVGANWEIQMGADASATLRITRSLSKTAAGEIFRAGIPGAGFSLKIRFLGTISAGLTAGMKYDVALRAGASFTSSFGASISSRHRVSVGLLGFSVSDLGTSGNNSPVSLAFDSPSANAGANVNGFIGLRPFIDLGIRLPLVGSSSVDLGATVGLAAAVTYRSSGFARVTSGSRIGVCNSCHAVQGTLNLEGRRLSISAKVGSLKRRETVISNRFMSIRLGTLCIYPWSLCGSRRTIIMPPVLGKEDIAEPLPMH